MMPHLPLQGRGIHGHIGPRERAAFPGLHLRATAERQHEAGAEHQDWPAQALHWNCSTEVSVPVWALSAATQCHSRSKVRAPAAVLLTSMTYSPLPPGSEM